MNGPARIAVLALALAGAAGTPAAESVEIVPLHHRSAESLLPVLRPLVGADAAVTGLGDRLVVRANESDLATILRVVAELDRAPRRLMITVRQDVDGAVFDRREELAAAYRTAPDGEAGGASAYALHTRSAATEHGEQRVQALEGEPAFIAAGQSVPVAERNVYLGPGVPVVQDTVRYRDLSNGFYVVPQLAGDRVTLRISPHRERLDPSGSGRIERGGADTIVSGRLGEWLEIGGSDADYRAGAGARAAHTRVHERTLHTIHVRVDALP